MSGSEEQETQLKHKHTTHAVCVDEDANEASNMEIEEDSSDESGSNWPDDKTARLIEMWKERGALYDITHRHYRNKLKKAKALNQICQELDMSRMY